MRKVIYPNLTEKVVPNKLPIAEIEKLLGCDILDTFRLGDDGNHVVFVDDLGHSKGLPINVVATKLYWDRCRGPNGHYILGAVYVCPDDDFATFGE